MCIRDSPRSSGSGCWKRSCPPCGAVRMLARRALRSSWWARQTRPPASSTPSLGWPCPRLRRRCRLR
eukprot:7857499-Alexandrium_andersonii.AAC.1